MRQSRNVAVLAAVGVGVTLAACSGSSKSATGPTAAAAAATFDSAYLADSAFGSPARAGVERVILIMLNQGAAPSKGSITTDAGNVSVQTVGIDAYDTAGGAVADSVLIVGSWSSDYSTYLLTEYEASVGPDLVPPHRIGVSARQVAALRASIARLSGGSPVRARSVSDQIALLVQGTVSEPADTVSISPTVAAASGSCAWEGFNIDPTEFGSSSPCSKVTITESFALHFPPATGIDASMSHISLAPAKAVSSTRVLLFD